MSTTLDRINRKLCDLFDAGDLPRLEKACDQINAIAAHAAILRTILTDSQAEPEELPVMEKQAS